MASHGEMNMRHFTFVALAIALCFVLGCGGSVKPPEGYSQDEGWITTPSGLKFRDIISPTTGAAAQYGRSVTVNYRGWLRDGTIFDSSANHGEPFTFTIGTGQVIPGWDEGLMGLRVGARTELIIPPSLAYGDQEQGKIPANSTLYFWVEIVSVN